MNAVSSVFQRILEWATILLMVVLTAIVLVAVLYRLSGNSLSWYDEIASILLSWITYYGAALAALKRRHIGFDGVLLGLPIPMRKIAVVIAEILVISFFVLLAWAGFEILSVLAGDTLVALTWMPVQITQSVIPVGAVLFIAAELLSLPLYWRATMSGHSLEHGDFADEAGGA